MNYNSLDTVNVNSAAQHQSDDDTTSTVESDCSHTLEDTGILSCQAYYGMYDYTGIY